MIFKVSCVYSRMNPFPVWTMFAAAKGRWSLFSGGYGNIILAAHLTESANIIVSKDGHFVSRSRASSTAEVVPGILHHTLSQSGHGQGRKEQLYRVGRYMCMFCAKN